MLRSNDAVSALEAVLNINKKQASVTKPPLYLVRHCADPGLKCGVVEMFVPASWCCDGNCIELARTIYIRCIYGILGRKITKYTVIYGVSIRFWPNLVCSDKKNAARVFWAT
jgi:ribosomal protein L16/L10AE